jgi:hypothetical protein
MKSERKSGWFSKKELEKIENDAFYQGFAVVAGSLARDHGQPSMARDIMQCNGVTLRRLRAAKVEPFDLGPLSNV